MSLIFQIDYEQLFALRIQAADLLQAGHDILRLTDEVIGRDEDALYLAKAIQGEGAALFGEEKLLVGLWIGHTAINLFEATWQGGRWPTVAAVVKDRFHGYVNTGQPEDWAWATARKSLARERDLTGGALAMLSRADLRRHGWPLRDDLLLHEFTGPEGHTMRFYWTWADEWK